jgi:predicted metal-dependent peptidase
MKGNMPQEIKDLLESKVDWREVLREFITSTCSDKDISTWRRPNRRWVDRDVYLPSTIGESVGRIVIGADMSGSMHDVLGRVLGEIVRISSVARPEGIDLLYWDTHVCAVEKYDLEDLDSLLNNTKPVGGGGTNPQCVSDYIRDHKLKPECIIMLTDGYVDGWGTGWNAPVLWGITSKGITAGNGVTVSIGDE